MSREAHLIPLKDVLRAELLLNFLALLDDSLSFIYQSEDCPAEFPELFRVKNTADFIDVFNEASEQLKTDAHLHSQDPEFLKRINILKQKYDSLEEEELVKLFDNIFEYDESTNMIDWWIEIAKTHHGPI